MRTKYLVMFFTAAIAGGIALNYTNTTKQERSYVPENTIKDMYSQEHFQDWLYRVKANQETGDITPDMLNSVDQAMTQFLSKSGNHSGFNWKERGPNNIGGRTRALLIDKNNPNTIWAGAVGGGIWKSTTSGQYWERIPYSVPEGYTPISVSSITQAADGKIFFGTGESFKNISDDLTGDNELFNSNNMSMPYIRGGGIFKQEGDTFVRLVATAPSASSDFLAVRRLAAHPTEANNIIASTTTGLWETQDGGTTWSKAVDAAGQSWDVAIATDGTVIANVSDKTYRRLPGETGYTVISGAISENKLTEIKGRYVYCFLQSDPNCVFASITDTIGDLEGVYRSLDKGTTWTQIGFGHSSHFVPFGSKKEGFFAHSMLAISNTMVLLAGADVWAGTGREGQASFEWNKILYSLADEDSPVYIHSGIHSFAQQTASKIFIGTDGGIYRLMRSSGGFSLKTMNTYYNTTMCYRADINNAGQIIVGTQDNGTLLLKNDLAGSQSQFGRKIMGRNGMECLFSRLSNDVLISSSQHGNTQRSSNLGRDFYLFWSQKMTTDNGWNKDNLIWPVRSASWITPMALWECDDFSYIRVDVSRVMGLIPYVANTPYLIQSANVAGQYLWWVADKDYAVGDTISFNDPYQAVFMIGLGNKLWYTKKALNFSPIGRFDWWDIYDRTKIDNVTMQDDPSWRFVAVTFSPDGDIAYGVTEPTVNDSAVVFRIRNLHACTKPRHAALNAFNNNTDTAEVRKTDIQRIGQIKGRYVTDLEVDPHNPEALIISMGQYGNTDHVYVAKNAATTTSKHWEDNFVSIQGNLPAMPIYSVCVNKNENSQKQLLVGTEYGVFVTDDYLSSNVTWQEGNNGLGHYPVFDIKQTYNQRRTQGTFTYGTFVIATYGRGVFSDTTHQYTYTSIDNPDTDNVSIVDGSSLIVKLYPNPASVETRINISVTKRSVVDITVYDLSGKIVYVNKTPKLEAGTHTFEIPVSTIGKGTFLVQCVTGNTRKTEKLIVE